MPTIRTGSEIVASADEDELDGGEGDDSVETRKEQPRSRPGHSWTTGAVIFLFGLTEAGIKNHLC